MLPSNNNLYNIQKEYARIIGLIEEADGEITPELEQALQFTEQQLTTEGTEIGFVIKAMEDWVDLVDDEIKRLESIREKAKKGRELLKNRLTIAMQQFGIERIIGPTITVSFRKSEAVEIQNESVIPAAYLEHPPAYPSKSKIKEALKKGIIVPGAEMAQRKHLQIK